MKSAPPSIALESASPALREGATGYRIPSNNFDFLRLLFAIMVIAGHSYALYSNDPKTLQYDPLFVAAHGQESFGHLAVASFFAISGFLILHSLLRSRSFADYFKKRVLRIYPGFIAATLVGVVAVLPLSLGRFPGLLNLRTGLHVLRCCVMLRRVEVTEYFEKAALPRAFAGNPFAGVLNGSMWTIAYEFGCYLALAALGWLMIRRNRRAGMYVLAALFAAAYLTNLTWNLNFNPVEWPRAARRFLDFFLGTAGPWPDFLQYFFSGGLFYMLLSQGLLRLRPVASELAALAALAVLALVARYPVAPNALVPACMHHHAWLLVLQPLLWPYILFTLAFSPWIPARRFGKFGDFSYGTYLYAFPIQQLLVQYLQPRLNGPLLFLLAAPWAVLCGFLSWHGVEKWFLRLKPPAASPTTPLSTANGST